MRDDEGFYRGGGNSKEEIDYRDFQKVKLKEFGDLMSVCVMDIFKGKL